ncbi:MAG TPA: hypothetical protein VF765_31685 [Polyangiaceae bacterium]
METRALLPFALFLAAAVLPGAVACSSSSSGGGTPAPSAGSPALLGEDCDPIEPSASECGLPYPSNVWTVKDSTTPTGLRQFYGPTTLPVWQAPSKHVDPTVWKTKDGFSPGSVIMAYWPDVDVSKLPNPTTIAQSTTTSSPTIIMEYATGKLVPHFDEIDMLPTTHDGQRAFMMRPVTRLNDAARYIVAIRHLTDSTGAAIAPSDAFKALRDGTSSNDVSVGLRRDLYKDILGKLKANGVDPSDLQMAWDFTTASKDNTTSDMVSIRDQALAVVGTDGPKYTITKVTPNPNPYIRVRLQGNMTVPLYLTTPSSCNGEPGCPGCSINRDASGKPAQTGTADYPFTVQIPNSVVNLGITAPILQNAHGLFGDQSEGQDGYLAEIADRLHYVTIAVDLVGMNSEDGNWIPNAIAGDISVFAHLPDRLHQGFANELMAMRMMMGKMATDPATMPDGKPTIDTTHRYYRGDSQGGISGGVYMAISTDVTRGLLDNTGAPYTMLLDRSRDFQPFFLVLKGIYTDPVQQQLLINLIQQLWDNAEPDGYIPYISENMLANTPAHNVIIHDGLGDQQVTPLGAQFEARTIGAKNLMAVNREVWGIDDAQSGFTGNGYIEFAFPGLPPDPITNIPPPSGNPDPHDALRQLNAAQDMVDQFFKTGAVTQTCANGGPCSAPMNWSNIPLLTPADQIPSGQASDAGDAGVGDASAEATTDSGSTGDATSD